MSEGPTGSGWRRHLQGWPFGLWIVALAGLTALLVVPRDVAPELVPPPRVDRLEQRRARALERDRAAAGAALPVEVRSVGEALRRYGRAAFSDSDVLAQLTLQLQRLAKEALASQGAERLLALRALQTELWLRALQGRPAQPGPEAVELAGGLLEAGLSRGWFAPPPDGAEDAELETLFRLYWGNALGLGAHHPFAPTLNEWRVYYRFMLGRPLRAEPERHGDLLRQLEYVAALSQHDPDYPAHLARGILLFRGGSPADAAIELRTHLELFPDGPWALRAKNHLAACGALLIE